MSNDISPTGDISTDETSKLTPLSSAAGAVSDVISEDTFRVIPSFKEMCIRDRDYEDFNF